MDLPKAISLLHRKMNMELNTRLSEIGLTTAKSMLIKRLHQNGEMTQVDLGKELGLDKSTVAKTLLRMEDRGLVTKQVNPEDSRSFLVSLTPEAVALYPQIIEISESWRSDVTAEMTADERSSFFRLLHKATSQAAKIGDK